MDGLKNFVEQFISLPKEEWDWIMSLFETKTLKKKEFFAEEGKYCNLMAFVSKGMLRHYYLVDGNDTTRWIAFENSFITSSISFFRNVPSTEFIVALEDCELFVLNRQRWDSLFEKIPSMMVVRAKIMEENYLGMEERLYETMNLSAEERYHRWLERYPDHAQRVPLQYIASMLAITPQHLSRIRRNRR